MLPARREHDDCSRFVVAAIRSIDCSGGLALDIPGGEGRHSRYLATQGFEVVCADLDLKALLRGTSASRSQTPSSPALVCLDATQSLPFPQDTFDLAIIVHFQMDAILPQVEPVIKSGGYLVLETFGAHGQNWLTLPLAGALRTKLENGFHIVQYTERAVGKAPDRVTVRAVGRKK